MQICFGAPATTSSSSTHTHCFANDAIDATHPFAFSANTHKCGDLLGESIWCLPIKPIHHHRPVMVRTICNGVAALASHASRMSAAFWYLFVLYALSVCGTRVVRDCIHIYACIIIIQRHRHRRVNAAVASAAAAAAAAVQSEQNSRGSHIKERQASQSACQPAAGVRVPTCAADRVAR